MNFEDTSIVKINTAIIVSGTEEIKLNFLGET